MGGLRRLPLALCLVAAGAGVGAGWAAFDALWGSSSSASTGSTGPTGVNVAPYQGEVGIFDIGELTYRVLQFGVVTVKGFVPALDYDGPSGCAGRIFIVSQSQAVFRYTDHNALLQDGDQLYFFPRPPIVSGHTLGWSSKFSGAGKTEVVTAVIYCRPPPASIPPLARPSGS